jgi:RNA polymerase primary sigma factor
VSTAIERLYGSTENLNRALDAQPSSGDPIWTAKPRSASITGWGIEQLWKADHGRHDHGNLADAADEQFVVLAALDGDEAAWASLMRAYIPAIQAVVARHSQSALENEDIRQTAMEGFVGAVREYDADKATRVAGLVKFKVSEALSKRHGQSFVATVPRRTRERVTQILRVAEGDAVLAEELAPEYGMSRRTFREAYQGFQAIVPPLHGQDGHPKTYTGAMVQELANRPLVAEPTTVEDAELVDAAMSADLTERERAVVVLSFGLTGRNPMTDGQIGEAVGVSRSRAAHIKADAVAKMRAHVNAEEN